MSEVKIEPWTDEQCLMLEPTWQLCRARRDAHHSAFRYYNKYYNMVSLPPILVGAVLSTISLNQDAVPAGVSAALAIFMTGMSTISSFFNLAKTQEGHRQIYRSFNLLVREIETSIIRGRESPKRSFVDFLEYINDTFTKLVEDAPTLNAGSRAILDKYRNERPSPFEKLLKGQEVEANLVLNEKVEENLNTNTNNNETAINIPSSLPLNTTTTTHTPTPTSELSQVSILNQLKNNYLAQTQQNQTQVTTSNNNSVGQM